MQKEGRSGQAASAIKDHLQFSNFKILSLCRRFLPVVEGWLHKNRGAGGLLNPETLKTMLAITATGGKGRHEYRIRRVFQPRFYELNPGRGTSVEC
jgi:hypothetical protein